jgi:rRNA-processing protein FCF1
VKQVIIDTNFLLIPEQFGVDIFSEIDRLMQSIMDKTLDELKKLSDEGHGKDKRAARLGIAFVAAKKMGVLKAGEEYVDAAIERLAARDKYVVCTQDGELKRKLKARGVSVITMRKRDYLIRVDG